MHASYSEPVPVWKLCRCVFPGVLGGHVQLYAIVIYTNVGDLEMYNLVLNVLSKIPPSRDIPHHPWQTTTVFTPVMGGFRSEF